MTSSTSGSVDAQQPSAREKVLEEALRDTRILFSCTKDDFRFVSYTIYAHASTNHIHLLL